MRYSGWPSRSVDDRAGDPGVDGLAVRPDVALVEREHGQLAGDQLGELRDVAVPVIGMGQVTDGQRQQLGLGAADHPLERRVGAQVLAGAQRATG